MSERRQEFLEELKRKIRRAEGTASEDGYNVTLNYGAYDPPSNKSISEMTLAELKKHQEGMLAHKDNKLNSSAAGAYQFTKSTLFGAKNKKTGKFMNLIIPKIKIYGKNSSSVAKIKLKLNEIKNNA